MTGRVKVLGYRFAAVVVDVSQMLQKMNCEGPGSLANINEVARPTGDGIQQVVALTYDTKGLSQNVLPTVVIFYCLCALPSAQPPSLPDSLVKLAYSSKQHYSWHHLL